MSFSFSERNKLSWALWGYGELIQDVFIPKTQYDIWARDLANRKSEMIAHMGRKVEVK